MKPQRAIFHFIFTLISATLAFAQAGNYFPSAIGHSWKYDVVYLGTGDTVIESTRHYEIDSLSASFALDGKTAYEVYSQMENGAPNGTSYFAFEGTSAFLYLPTLPAPLDTLINIPPPQWTTALKFTTGFTPPWIIFEWDTTVTIDSVEIPASFRIQGERVAVDEEITVQAGTFTTYRFNINEQIGTRFLNQFIPLYTLVDTLWVAPGNWIVKQTRSALTVALDTVSFTIPGLSKELVASQPPLATLPEISLPSAYSLEQNYPNPFNPSTVIRYSLTEQRYVRLVIYDMLGREIETLADGIETAGEHTTIWNAKDLSAGVYILRLETGTTPIARKMLLLR